MKVGQSDCVLHLPEASFDTPPFVIQFFHHIDRKCVSGKIGNQTLICIICDFETYCTKFKALKFLPNRQISECLISHKANILLRVLFDFLCLQPRYDLLKIQIELFIFQVHCAENAIT